MGGKNSVAPSATDFAGGIGRVTDRSLAWRRHACQVESTARRRADDTANQVGMAGGQPSPRGGQPVAGPRAGGQTLDAPAAALGVACSAGGGGPYAGQGPRGTRRAVRSSK